jgi:hypothetical protein
VTRAIFNEATEFCSVRPRLPSFDWFSVACGLFVGGLVVAVPTPTLVGGTGLPVLGGLTTWALLEQSPGRIDRVLLARGHYIAGGLAVALLAVALLGRTDWLTVPNSLTIPLLALSMLAVIVAGTGDKRRAAVIRRESTHMLTVQAEKSRLYAVSKFVVSALVTVGVTSPLLADPVVPGLVGAGLGGLIAMVFTWTPSVELTATDRALLVAERPDGDDEAIPWRRIRRISTEESTVRIWRGLPWPMRYQATFESPAEAERRADTFRRCRRSVDE